MLHRITLATGRLLSRWVRQAEHDAEQRRLRRLRSRFAACGAGVRIYSPFRISAPEATRFGDNVHIGENAHIHAEGGLTIGDNSHISRNLVLYTVNHRWRDGVRLPYDEDLEHKPVIIGRNVWIGMNVCIAPGTTIGDGAVIGMGTVVSGDVPEQAIIVGSKWRIVGYRDTEHYQALDSDMKYGGINGWPYDVKEGVTCIPTA